MTTINFDGAHVGSGGLVADGYRGMDWNDFGYVNAFVEGGGYANGLISNFNVGYNTFANPASFSTRDTDFDLKKAYFTGAWNNDLTITVTAYDDGVVVRTKTFEVDEAGPTLVRFHHFDSIDSVTIESSGGVDANPEDGVGGTQFVVDDIKVKFEPAPVRADDYHHDHALLDGFSWAQDWVLAG